jgi:hypothetical protein
MLREAQCPGLLPPLPSAAFHIWVKSSVQLALAGPGSPFSMARVAMRLRRVCEQYCNRCGEVDYDAGTVRSSGPVFSKPMPSQLDWILLSVRCWISQHTLQRHSAQNSLAWERYEVSDVNDWL